MANKKPIKLSEARILIYLNNTHRALHFVRKISSKLKIDYGYTIRILMDMIEKEWLCREKGLANPSRTYYHISEIGKSKLPTALNIAAERVGD
ncbi:MAG: hypothetical protein U9N86_10355 [Bacteroidota bacterium]|nr:hypothetical protein [Bacteroidota bacterium]